MPRMCVVALRFRTEFPTILLLVPSSGGTIDPRFGRFVDKSGRRMRVERQVTVPKAKREERFKVAHLGPEREEDVRHNIRSRS